MTVQERLARLRESHERVPGGPYCLCGNFLNKCQYHKEGADPTMRRAADLWAIIEDLHEYDYDSCSIDEPAVIDAIATYLRGEA